MVVERCTPHTFIFTATPILPRATVVCQPLHDTHRVGVESLTEPHVEHCITHTQRARESSWPVKETREMETGAGQVESIRVKHTYVFSLRSENLCNCDSHLFPSLCSRANDSEVPSNFISKADVKVGLSNVMPLLGRVDSL